MPTDRTSVFISYAHADQKWLGRLEEHLRPLKRDHKLQIFSDQDLKKGERWRARIRRELARAKVAVLLVSPSFLASDFINSDELPPLLKAVAEHGTVLLTLILRPCAFHHSPLAKLQTVNDPAKPLSGATPTQRDAEMVKLYNELARIFGIAAVSASPIARRKTAAKPKPGIPTRPKRVKKEAAKAAKPKTPFEPVAPKTPAKPKPKAQPSKSATTDVKAPGKRTPKAKSTPAARPKAVLTPRKATSVKKAARPKPATK